MITELISENITTLYEKQHNNIDINIDISTNRYIVLNDSCECPICFDEIKNDDAIIIMECCNKKVHIRCLYNWYSVHRTNKTCFMCTQSNSFCNELVFDDTQITISSNNTENDNINNYIPHNIYPMKRCIIICDICVALIIVTCSIILLISFV